MEASNRPERQLFEAARELNDGPDRQAYLDAACAGNPELRRGVERLLAADRRAESFFAEGEAALNRSIQALTIAEQPGDSIGRYKLLQQIGEGGCGVVYMAEQEEPVRRRVALKIIKFGMDTKTVVARFEAERQALALMDHPHIARIYDAGATPSGRPYFVMELVRGMKITEYCDEQRLPTRERLTLFLAVCDAVQHAHQKGIIHRDLKPSNILVTINDGVAVPKVIDFGIAKAVQGRLTDKTLFTAFEQLLGTPAYMSPEQALMTSLDVDTRSDIYSLGVLLYELLTGKTPFDTQSLLAAGIERLRQTICEVEPIRPSTRLRSMPLEELTTAARRHCAEPPKLVNRVRGDLDWIVMKCLEKDRARRYETANGLAMELRRHLSNEPVRARPPSAAYRFQKAWRRNKLIYSAGLAVFVALAAGLALAAFGWKQARAEREETRRRVYAAEINAGFKALDENNLTRAADLLNRQRPRPGEEDLRGFEWRLLWQLCQHDEKRTFPKRHSDGIAFSPDGKWLAYGNSNIVIRAWPSLAVVRIIPEYASFLAFSPQSHLLATTYDTNVIIWKAESWEKQQILPGTRFPAVFSPDGRWLVTGALRAPGEPGGYRVWNTDTWQPGPIFGSELERVYIAKKVVAFSDDGKLLVTAGHPGGRDSGHQFQVWDFPSLTVRSNFATFPGRLSCAAFSPDGKYLLTGTGESVLLVWNVAEGRIVERLNEHTGWVSAITYAPDRRSFVTASSDRTLIVWDGATWQPLARFRGHFGEVFGLAISPDGSMMASGAMDGTMKLWDLSVRHARPILPGCALVTGFSSDSHHLVGAGFTEARVWNLKDRTMRTIPLEDYSTQHYREHYQFLSASRDVHGSEPMAIYGRADGRVQVWNLATMSLISSWPTDHRIVQATAFSPDGQLIATGGADGQVALWELRTHREIRRFEPLEKRLMCLTFSPDGRLLAGSEFSEFEDSQLGLWDVTTGALLRRHHVQRNCVLSLAFSPDGKLLASGEQNAAVRLWEIPSGALHATLTGHLQPVASVAFSPDSKTLATTADDCRAKLWNIATEQEMLTLKLEGGGRSVKFSPDGRTLAVGYALEPDQYIRLFDAPSFAEIAAAELKANADPKQP